MTDKQRNFCDEYIKVMNIGQAYMAAYPSIRSAAAARACGCRLLTKANVQEYIQERLQQISSQKIATAEEILQYLTSVLRGESVAHELVIVKGQAKLIEKPPTQKERLEAAKILARLFQKERITELKAVLIETKIKIDSRINEADEGGQSFLEALETASDIWSEPDTAERKECTGQ